MKREIGGYFGMEEYRGSEFHSNAIPLNTGRNCLRYLIRSREIKKIALPYYICNAVIDIIKAENVQIAFYNVSENLYPDLSEISDTCFLYLVNYFGQLTEYFRQISQHRSHLIIDNSQAFFESPILHTDTIYTCRKYFGVTDGAYLYTDAEYPYPISLDASSGRIGYLMGRYEDNASDYFDAFQENERKLNHLELMYMSKATHNLLRPINYSYVSRAREDNFSTLESRLSRYNQLNLTCPKGPYMYPLFNKQGQELRKRLISRKVYIPTLWPHLLEQTDNLNAKVLARDIVPIPCDQRYSTSDMDTIADIIEEFMGG